MQYRCVVGMVGAELPGVDGTVRHLAGGRAADRPGGRLVEVPVLVALNHQPLTLVRHPAGNNSNMKLPMLLKLIIAAKLARA